jgi:hypothetical protein
MRLLTFTSATDRPRRATRGRGYSGFVVNRDSTAAPTNRYGVMSAAGLRDMLAHHGNRCSGHFAHRLTRTICLYAGIAADPFSCDSEIDPRLVAASRVDRALLKLAFSLRMEDRLRRRLEPARFFVEKR